ncbi:MAG: hypothetical protein WC516_01310 [Patescibacteria group bacterium]
MKLKYHLFFCVLALLVLVLPAKAAEFDPSYLISDTEIRDYNALDQNDIQNFLQHRNGTLEKYITVDKENNFKTAVQSFYEIAQKWRINPKYLLVLVQKEQSLLEDTSPSQGQYDRATGYGCPDSGGCDDRWKGFYKQVNSAAAQTDYYMNNINEFYFKPGGTYNIDNQTVTIKNTATAGLYNYTPHIHGNLSFWNLWNQYFSKKWPDGTLIQADDSDQIYLIENGQRRAIVSKAVFVSRFDPEKVVTVAPEDVNSYAPGPDIKYLNFSLLKNSAGNIYMIVDIYKRKIESQEVFKKLGFSDDDVTSVSDTELALYQDGPNITSYTVYPTGTLVQDQKTKQIFYILSGTKRLVPTPEIQKANFLGMTIKKVTSADLDLFPGGDPMTLPEGLLVKIKTASTVYVISNGKKLPIFSSKVFNNMKYKWKNIKVVSADTLNAHPLGQTITGEW